MSRRFLMVAGTVLLVPYVAVAAGVQDSLRVDRDSVDTRGEELVYLSDEVETWGDLPGSGMAESRFSWLWRLPETLEEVAGGLAPESARLTGLPLMRGMNAKRTAITFDGIPLDHSGLREGPSVIPLGVIDPAVIGGFRVVRGPTAAGSSSDGVAGVIDIRSSLDLRDDERSGLEGTSVLVSQRLSSADRGWSGGLSVGGEAPALRYRFGGAGRLLGDMRAGSGAGVGPSLQKNTSLSESTIHGLVSYDVTDRWNLRAAGVASWRQGQAVVDDLDDLRGTSLPDAIAVFDPRRFAFAYASSRVRDLGFVRVLESTVWYNGHRESRTFRRLDWGRTVFDDDRLNAMGIRTKATMKVIRDHNLEAEVDVKLEGADAIRWETRDDGSVWGQRGRFPVGTRSRLISLGLSDSWQISGNLKISGDAQLISRMIHSAYGPSVFGLTGLVGLVETTYKGVAWRLEVERSWARGWRLSASAASGFRAPGLDDQVANAFWLYGRDVPNPDLGPERVRQVELAGHYESGSLSIGAALFRASYHGLIGRDWFESGPDLVPGTEDDLFWFVNYESESVYGMEAEMAAGIESVAGLRVDVAGRVSLHRWSSDGVTTPHYLPPVVGRVGSRFTRGLVWLEPYVRFASRTPAPEYSVVGSVAGDTRGWLTINLRVGLRASDRLLVAAAVENAGDVRYREHSSYLESPGRNLIVSASYRF